MNTAGSPSVFRTSLTLEKNAAGNSRMDMPAAHKISDFGTKNPQASELFSGFLLRKNLRDFLDADAEFRLGDDVEHGFGALQVDCA